MASSTKPSSSLISTPGYPSTIELIFSSTSGVFSFTLKYNSVSSDSSLKNELFSSKTKNSAGGWVVQSKIYETVKAFSPCSGIVSSTSSPTDKLSLSAVCFKIPIVSFSKKPSLLPSISSVLTRSNTVSSTAPKINGL